MAESLIASPLFDRVLVVVAHPDDESIGCSILLQRSKQATVVFATDGGPHDAKFWRGYSSRAEYAGARRQEATAALGIVGVTRPQFLRIADQELFRNLENALAGLGAIITQRQPHALLTHAYEGGHPDHDACAFLVFLLAGKHKVDAWEMPLYHRVNGERAIQKFIPSPSSPADTEELVLTGKPEELERKRAMIAGYASQGDFIRHFDITREVFRRQPAYDFARPPHAGTLNYEEWQWPMTGSDVSRAFGALLKQRACA